MKLDHNYVEFVRATVDGLVRETGMPAVGIILQSSGVADRQLLRKLTQMGVLKVISMSAGQGVVNGYYTEGEVPNVIRRQQANADEPAGEPSEELQGGLRPADEAQKGDSESRA